MSDLVYALPVCYEDSPNRCGVCGKRKSYDIGPGPFGADQTHEFCLNCDQLTPESSWAAYDTGGPR